MVRLQWDNETSAKYQQGVSHGVFYGEDGVGHAWSGLIGVTEKPQTNAPTPVYNAMGEKYNIFGNIAEKKHGLTCYTYPEEMDEYLGLEYLNTYGFTVDERPPKKFHMAYRTELGNGLYEIHILINQIATFGETARSTMTDSPTLSTITMNLEGASDPRLKSSHIILDSRLPITKSAEVLLFGDRYTEANIHDFLTAEPVWETVAKNYAPIIEPDYDNYVWLGGENLLLNSDVNVSTSNHIAINPTLAPGHGLVDGEPITVSIKGQLGSDRTRFGIYNSDATTFMGSLMPSAQGSDGVYRFTTTWRSNSTNANLRVYQFNIDGTSESTIEWIKLERGTIHTPWTPAPSDPDQKPRAHDPYPENYKPGVIGFNTTPATIAFYDERHMGVGVYARTTNAFSHILSRSIPTQEILGSYLRLSTEVILEDNITNPTTRTGSMRVSSTGGTRTQEHSTVGTHIGSYETNMYTSNVTTGYDYVYFYHAGQAFLETITYRKPLITTSPTAEFFDANSTPPTKGDRYVRAQGHGVEYTLHQQLRLRSTSKVKLSDITQYDFWLEASDSMLLSQNETFTFSGPQAVIDGDTFTIDDSIQGYAEG